MNDRLRVETPPLYGPADHGRQMSLQEYLKARWQEGWRYELIRGRVEVSPAPDFPHERVEQWLEKLLDAYCAARPEIINYVSDRARIHLPDVERESCPEPDLAAFRDVPLERPTREINWENMTPVLVVEVLSEDNPDKDETRNVELYLQVPSIREYWILDPREDPDRPTMTVHRRRGQRWQRPIVVAPGEIYTTKLLPEFSLLLDPRARP